jgi:hypothetical protein
MNPADLRERPKLHTGTIAAVAIAGALLGSAWDLLHVRTHTTIYAIGSSRMPWWVPVEFALVYVAGVVGIARLGAPSPDTRTRTRLTGEVAWVSVVYATTAFGHRHELLVAALCIAGLIARGRTLRTVVRANPIPSIALVIAGPVVESVLIAAHVFRYTHASLGNIPLWLPLLYANAVPFAVRLAETAVSGERA